MTLIKSINNLSRGVFAQLNRLLAAGVPPIWWAITTYPGSMSEPRGPGRREDPKLPGHSATRGVRATGSSEDKGPPESRERLMRAGERLFARDGISSRPSSGDQQTRGPEQPVSRSLPLWEPGGVGRSHPGSARSVDRSWMKAGLDRIEDRDTLPTVREVMAATIHPLTEKLDSESGRDYLQIIQQLTPMLSANLRLGITSPTTPQGRRGLAILEQRLTLKGIPPSIRRERLVAYVLCLVGLLADRAHETERGRSALLEAADFESNLLDMLVGALTASPQRAEEEGHDQRATD